MLQVTHDITVLDVNLAVTNRRSRSNNGYSTTAVFWIGVSAQVLVSGDHLEAADFVVTVSLFQCPRSLAVKLDEPIDAHNLREYAFLVSKKY